MAYSRYYRSLLSPAEKGMYDALAAGFARIDAEIPIPFETSLNPSRYIQAVQLDYPELFYVDFGKLRVLLSPLRSRVIAAYHASAPLIRRQVAEIERIADGIVRGCAGKSLLDAECYLHDKLVSMCVYGDVAGREYDAHTIYGAFMDHKCVCEGYAKTFKYLCDKAKVQCLVVEGEATPPNEASGPHAWNMVNLGGAIYHVDVTFDHAVEQRYYSKVYFNLSDTEIAVDHKAWSSMFKVPASPQSGAVIPRIGGTQQLMDFLKSEFTRKARYSEVFLTKGFERNELIDLILKKLKPEDYVWYNAIRAYLYGNGARSLGILWK